MIFKNDYLFQQLHTYILIYFMANYFYKSIFPARTGIAFLKLFCLYCLVFTCVSNFDYINIKIFLQKSSFERPKFNLRCLFSVLPRIFYRNVTSGSNTNRFYLSCIFATIFIRPVFNTLSGIFWKIFGY